MALVNAWLSSLGELKQSDSGSDTESTGSLSRTVTATSPNLPKEILDEIDKAVKADNAQALRSVLEESQKYSNQQRASSQKLLHNVLQRSIACFSRACILLLLGQLPTLDQEDDINKRNCLHRLVLSIARAKSNHLNANDAGALPAVEETASVILAAEAPGLHAPAMGSRRIQDEVQLDKDDVSVTLFRFILDGMAPIQREALKAQDALGRMPLHYAAQFGFSIICEVILTRMHDWSQLNTSVHLDSPGWEDNDGDSPLYLSVCNGRVETTKYLLYAWRQMMSNDNPQIPTGRLVGHSNTLLTVAAKSNHSKTISLLLLEAGADVNEQDAEGEIPLHTAARFGYLESAKALITSTSWQSVMLDVPELTFDWTPLIVASVEGHLPLVEILARSGADTERTDASGWTATEHAALRGHLRVAEYLASRPISKSPLNGLQDLSKVLSKTLSDRTSSAMNRDRSSANKLDTVKSFGHRYLRDESLILVSLGSMDQRKDFKPVTLDNIPLAEAHATQLDTALSVIVSASGAAKSTEPTIIDLPVNENISTDPIAFTTRDATKVKLLFDIVPTYSGAKDSVIGRGVALLSSVKANIGSKRMNLQGDISVPIIASKTMEYIGTVNFNFLVITPFSHPNMSVSAEQTYWKSMTGPTVIGHRGMGKNMTSRKSLQLGENTLQSFIAAANLGASYVEFDVQLTKDHVPVIYHDFLVSETGIDAPVHTLTLEQFLHVNQTSTPRTSRPPSPKASALDGAVELPKVRERAQSLGARGSTPMTDMSERMKHTRDFKLKGYKGNSRGTFIQAPFTTLEEMLKTLPEQIGFNIEMKYPMLFESEEQEMDTYAVELNSFVDTVLKMVYDYGKQRDILFSSFNPDICLLLSFKQPSIPILFLTDAGTETVGDIRASSLQEAIRFASRWNLLGIVSAAEPLVTCPRLVRVVKESGLVCVSYGTLNNEPRNVKKQVDEGIDAVIVDSVLAIRQGLTHPLTREASAEIDRLPGFRNGGDPTTVTINGVPLSEYQYGAVV